MVRHHNYYVYIMASISNVLYIGVSNNLQRRVIEHKRGLVPGFTRKYKCHRLVYYEQYGRIEDAIHREKQLKNWRREWKLDLIRNENSNLVDLSMDWLKKDPESSSG